ncbi:hypothetical protein C8J57DRAFT_1256776 [Mycena rebaudengoi]|nr:hypothetical protein C8J57DRAFT_1256776 [Mycena rebaudengoi]
MATLGIHSAQQPREATSLLEQAQEAPLVQPRALAADSSRAAYRTRRDMCDANELNGGRDTHDVSQRMALATPVTKINNGGTVSEAKPRRNEMNGRTRILVQKKKRNQQEGTGAWNKWMARAARTRAPQDVAHEGAARRRATLQVGAHLRARAGRRHIARTIEPLNAVRQAANGTLRANEHIPRKRRRGSDADAGDVPTPPHAQAQIPTPRKSEKWRKQAKMLRSVKQWTGCAAIPCATSRGRLCHTHTSRAMQPPNTALSPSNVTRPVSLPIPEQAEEANKRGWTSSQALRLTQAAWLALGCPPRQPSRHAGRAARSVAAAQEPTPRNGIPKPKRAGAKI